MKAMIIFTKEWTDNTGESERIVNNLTEVHYGFSAFTEGHTAFESDIDSTGFSIPNRYIREFEITPEDTP